MLSDEETREEEGAILFPSPDNLQHDSSNSSFPPTDASSAEPMLNISRVDEEDTEAKLCRVCHCEEEEGRPLFYPCKCAGSIKYVHQVSALRMTHSTIPVYNTLPC